MSDDKNNQPIDEADVLKDLAFEKRRGDLALEVIHCLDRCWPAWSDKLANCRYCEEPLPKHKPNCIVKVILRIQ